MARPLKWKSHDGATEEGGGRHQATKAHDEFGLYARLYDGFDPEADSVYVTLEVAVDEPEGFVPVIRGAPREDDAFRLETDDFVEDDENDGVYVGYIGQNSFPTEFLRASIHELEGDFTVDTWVLVTGETGGARRYSQPDGP